MILARTHLLWKFLQLFIKQIFFHDQKTGRSGKCTQQEKNLSQILTGIFLDTSSGDSKKKSCKIYLDTGPRFCFSKFLLRFLKGFSRSSPINFSRNSSKICNSRRFLSQKIRDFFSKPSFFRIFFFLPNTFPWSIAWTSPGVPWSKILFIQRFSPALIRKFLWKTLKRSFWKFLQRCIQQFLLIFQALFSIFSYLNSEILSDSFFFRRFPHQILHVLL